MHLSRLLKSPNTDNISVGRRFLESDHASSEKQNGPVPGKAHMQQLKARKASLSVERVEDVAMLRARGTRSLAWYRLARHAESHPDPHEHMLVRVIVQIVHDRRNSQVSSLSELASASFIIASESRAT